MKLVYSFLLSVSFVFLSPALKAFQLYCPGDVWVGCNDEIWDLSIYGNAYYDIYGIYHDAGTPTVVYNLNSCNTGTIYRTWTVEDPYWNQVSCTQTIYVSGGHFSSANIHWPYQDLQLYGCNTSIHPNDLPYGYDKPHYDYMTCSQVGVSYDDKVFYFGPDCKKILRKWTLIDWCNYIPGSQYHGIWTYTQVIKISNTETPLLSCAKEIVINAQECDSSYVDVPLVNVEGMSCTGEYGISNNSYYADYKGADASGKYPLGTTKVEYTVEYACGKEVKCRTDIKVKDNKPAVPYCYSGLNVALMPVDSDNDGNIDDGMVEVWAQDLNVGSYHPCNNGPLIFSFSADASETSRTFTCADVGVNAVQMWVTDINGNQSFCYVNLSVQNNAANIPDCKPDEGKKYVLSGKTFDEDHDELENVQVTLKDRVPVYQYITEKDSIYNYEVIDSFYNSSNVLVHIYNLTIEYFDKVIDSIPHHNVMHLMSNQNGVYGTNDILLYRNYEITAYKPGDMSRVNNSDLEILKAFVDGEYQFKNKYSYLAADINEDTEVNNEDVLLLEELLSGEEDEWPKERQWIFYNMQDMATATDYPLADHLSQDVRIQNIQDKSHHLDFMGILKGDLDKYESMDEVAGLNEKINLRNSQVDKDISVFPNPFTSNIRVGNPKGEAGKIKVFSSEGRLIYSGIINKSQSETVIPDSELWNKGNYFLSIETENDKKTIKLIKL
ncbi:MAG: T9SS type A sorting domain-containing protein [Bacteroidia bacterium]|nr:T9SS type A sorting domain-containing protein [Bacteroidia bacterium]